MRFGAFMPLTDTSISPSDFGRLLEEYGYESIFLPEHTHIPVDSASAFPLGGDTPDEYRRLFDPFVALTAVAMATRNLRIATGVCLVLQHDTVALAKRVATLDVLSGGRVLFGVGAGWNRAEMKTHGVDPSTRMDAMVEVTEALQAMWTQDEAQYAGTYVRFAPLWSWPKPKQPPHPPVLMGGNHHNTLRRVVRTGSEWLPNLGRLDEEGLARRLGELRALAAERGAPAPATTAFRINPKAQVIEQLTELGVHRSVIALPPGDESATRYRLERFSPLLKDFATR